MAQFNHSAHGNTEHQTRIWSGLGASSPQCTIKFIDTFSRFRNYLDFLILNIILEYKYSVL